MDTSHKNLMFKLKLLGFLFNLFGFLFTVLKWLFMPVAFLFAIFIGIPYTRFYTTLAIKPDVALVDDTGLDNESWYEIETLRHEMLALGFESGQTVVVNDMIQHITCYVHSMVHAESQIGVGLNFINLEVAGQNEYVSSHLEFTGRCQEGFTVDLTNADDMDPFPSPSSRKRLFRPYEDSHSLFALFQTLVRETGCNIGDEHLTALTKDLCGIVLQEYTELFQHYERCGYIVPTAKQRYRMTWKGAWLSTWRNMWPTANWYKAQREVEMEKIFKANNICVEEVVNQVHERLNQPNHSKPISTPITDIESAMAHSRLYQPDALSPNHIECQIGEGNRIDSMLVQFINLKKVPSRPFQWVSESTIHIDNATLESTQDDIENSLYHMDEVADDELFSPAIPADHLAKVMPPEDILAEQHLPTVHYLELRHDREHHMLTWYVNGFDGDDYRELSLDAISGERLD